MGLIDSPAFSQLVANEGQAFRCRMAHHLNTRVLMSFAAVLAGMMKGTYQPPPLHRVGGSHPLSEIGSLVPQLSRISSALLQCEIIGS